MSHPIEQRDPRLDFFYGLAVLALFIDYLPQNFWALWSPLNFGFSGAIEIFIFCSGMVAALTFSNVYASEGWLRATARVVHRIWQVYWAYIAVFLVTAVILAAASDRLELGLPAANTMNISPLFADPSRNLLGLLTLTYVPDYVAILPMYIGILAMLPVAAALSEYSRLALGLFVLVLWCIAAYDLPRLSAEPGSEASWLFNPFGWQLVFFTGFAFMRGWLISPPVNRHLIAIAAAAVVISIPFASPALLNSFAGLRQANQALGSLVDPTNFGILRYIHFLALAYLAYAAAGPHGAHLKRLNMARWWTKVVAIVCLIGRQAFTVFLASLVIAQALSVGLGLTGRGFLTVTIANLAGFALLIASAQCAAYFKSQPWRQKNNKSLKAV
ncbi:MAG: OpgC domain-containing protein [Pseudomonadota bacterium]